MSVTTTFRSPGIVGISLPTDPVIYNVPALLADTEYSQLLNSNTSILKIRCRGTARIQYSFVAGESGTKFITLSPGASDTITGINFIGNIYFQLNQAGQTVEILEWS